MSLKRKRSSYDVKFKLNVIEYAKENSNCAAERKFGVTEKMVRDWRQKEDKLRNAPFTKIKKLRTGSSPYGEMETKLKEWILDLVNMRTK